MTNRIDATFARCKQEGKTAFITFIPCGYKEKADTIPILLACQAGGADIIEVGIPYSDPGADGPVIQRAHQNGVDQGITFADVLQTVSDARAQGLTVPVVLMGYFNNFLQYGLDTVCPHSKKAGVDGFIVVDLPPEEATEVSALTKQHGICFIPLVSPTTVDSRMRTIDRSMASPCILVFLTSNVWFCMSVALIAAVGSGFCYVVSLTGVTGSRNAMAVNLEEFVIRIRKHISLPLALGFGLSSKAHVQAAGKLVDGAVIGSKIVNVIDEAPRDQRAQKVKDFCLSITQ
ncbi:tryptophan synthase, alpha subunit [Aphanomyces astaci]|uniref:tryptophan synthase n=1 Tax=Aphanomyces astaci TaxID=112090 RepID=W4H4X5_APHAT|nr:tryptophan synthase, alpha subunit [Aphanomyces astaci]ETV86641.1 tryptophan synthase, alpha subunit [Aphanomyces astaci]|eukprot:XP_009823440.1 tryptophan synthase, alpha subunit [Aphanomyces astaci]